MAGLLARLRESQFGRNVKLEYELVELAAGAAAPATVRVISDDAGGEFLRGAKSIIGRSTAIVATGTSAELIEEADLGLPSVEAKAVLSSDKNWVVLEPKTTTSQGAKEQREASIGAGQRLATPVGKQWLVVTAMQAPADAAR